MHPIVISLIGFSIASLGSITPSFLNMTVVKFSLKKGRKPAIYLILGYVTILFLQANLGAYLANVLMKNSEYISLLQKLGTIILFILFIHFIRLHLKAKPKNKEPNIQKSKAYFHGILMATLNTFAIPFYFTTISLLISYDYFLYSYWNSFYFSIGSSIGSFTLYSGYAILSKKIENNISFLASKINLILAIITGAAAVINTVFLIFD